MRKHLRKVAMVFAPLFMFGMMTGCTPEKVNTAKSVMDQASFYVDMAEALIKVASAQFADKPKVKTALEATAASLVVVRAAMVAAKKGLDKDNAALKAAVIALVVEVFALARAIDEAKKASSAATP